MSAATRSARLKFDPPGVGPDGAKPVGTMRLSGVVRTTRGYAVAQVAMAPDGTMTVTLGQSQAFPEFVAREHQRIAVNATLKAQQ